MINNRFPQQKSILNSPKAHTHPTSTETRPVCGLSLPPPLPDGIVVEVAEPGMMTRQQRQPLVGAGSSLRLVENTQMLWDMQRPELVAVRST